MQVMESDWRLWETRLRRAAVGTDPLRLSLRQRVALVYGHLVDGKTAQQRESVDAVLEDRIAMNFATGRPLGMESPDPEVRLATRVKVAEYLSTHPEAAAELKRTPKAEGPYG